MNAFTNGPWRVAEQNCGGGINIVDAADRRIAHTACFYDNKNEPVNESEAQANAHLIAAAPGLYLVLEAIVHWHDKSRAIDSAWFEEARKILQNARGEA